MRRPHCDTYVGKTESYLLGKMILRIRTLTKWDRIREIGLQVSAEDKQPLNAHRKADRSEQHSFVTMSYVHTT